jgi:multimeric flavodoxin WrbA
LIKLLTICGSPTDRSSTEILLRRIEAAVVKHVGLKVRRSFVRLNELDYIACQACGESPEPKYCFFDDDLSSVHKKLLACDCLLFGSPIYFDALSAQAKAFIDRCNCFRAADFENTDPERAFIVRLRRKRPGAMVLVGGKKGWFEGARRSAAGFFKWVEVVNEGLLMFHSTDFNSRGEVANCPEVLAEADALGRRLAKLLKKEHGKRRD